MSNTPIVVSVLALVLVGMLFGLNFQVSESAVTFFNTMGTTLSGVGAAAAAYISYLSIGEWRQQTKHSLLYGYLSELEDLLLDLRRDFEKEAFPDSSLTMDAINNLNLELIKNYLYNYERTYCRSLDIMSEAMKKEFKCLSFFNITGELFDAHVNYFNEEKELNEAMKARRKAMSVVESAINKVRKLRRDL